MENNEYNFDLYQGQLQTYVGFTSFMTAVCTFFVGFLLSAFHSFDISIRVPIAFLIVSLFSFLYSTLLYTSAAAEVSLKHYRKFIKAVIIGDAISEYLGIYFLVAAIPLTVNAITTDQFLRLVTIVAALVGLAIYQFSSVSMIEQHFSHSSKAMALIAILMILLLSIGQILDFHFILLATIFLAFMLLLGYSAVRSGLKKDFLDLTS